MLSLLRNQTLKQASFRFLVYARPLTRTLMLVAVTVKRFATMPPPLGNTVL
jgi:hypothetical protein